MSAGRRLPRRYTWAAVALLTAAASSFLMYANVRRRPPSAAHAGGGLSPRTDIDGAIARAASGAARDGLRREALLLLRGDALRAATAASAAAAAAGASASASAAPSVPVPAWCTAEKRARGPFVVPQGEGGLTNAQPVSKKRFCRETHTVDRKCESAAALQRRDYA